MAENKQLGTLQLNQGNVIQVIDQVNAKLKTLGKGVDLDLTNLVKGKIDEQIKALKQQVDTATRTSTQQATKQNQAVREASTLLKEQYSLQSMLNRAKSEGERSVIQSQINRRSELLAAKQYTSEILKQAEATKSVQKARESYERSYEKTRWQTQQQSEKALADQQKSYEQMMAQARRQSAEAMDRGVMFVGRIALSAIREQWNAAIDYATSYYDTLNEIRVVTGKSEAEATQMGDNFRKLAKEMKVTSTELAGAAVTFYRQGLNDTEVNDRLNWVTKYAKVANIDFDTAAELITASSNAMSADIQGNIERVVDVFLYLGDAAATSGEEIGVAMQKASASATEFGLSFEWLGAYIATVAEQTRQAPQVIGTAFNSMMARLHQIRTTGYNEEDATKINDVAKALATVNIELMNSDGSWRDMSDIFTDISGKWTDMTDKQKSYIATTLAGTRQQNVFFALMNDMSKGLEGGSRAWELYTGAMNAAGTATEKYAVWQESIAASQANFQASMENIYASLQPNLVKGFYDVMTGIADAVANATSALGGFNLVIPAVIAGVVGIIAAINKAHIAVTGIGGAIKALGTVLAGHPLIAAAAALIGLVAASTPLINFFNDLDGSKAKYNDATDRYQESLQSVQKLKKEQQELNELFFKMQGGAQLTSVEMGQYNKQLENLASLSPAAKAAIDDFNRGVGTQAELMQALNTAYDELIAKEKERSKLAAKEGLLNFTPKSIRSPYDISIAAGELAYEWNTRNFSKEEKANADQIRGQSDAAKLSKDLAEDTKNVMAMLMAQVSDELNQVQYDTVYDMILKKVMALDGNGEILSSADMSQVRENVYMQVSYAEEIAAQALDRGAESNPEVGKQIVDRILGNIFNAPFDNLSQVALSYAGNYGLAKDISNAYVQWLELGLSNIDIRSLMEKLKMSLSDMAQEGIDSVLTLALPRRLSISSEDFFDTFSKKDAAGNIQFLNTEMMAQMYTLSMSGTTLEEFESAFKDSENMDEFLNKLNAIKEGTVVASDGQKETATSFKDISSALSEVEKIDSLIASIEDGKDIKLSDVLGLSEAHPELLAVIDDADALAEALRAIRDTKNTEMGGLLRSWLGDNESLAKSSPFAQSLTNGVTTLNDLRAAAEESGDLVLLDEIDAYLDDIVAKASAAAQNIEDLGADAENSVLIDFFGRIDMLGKQQEALSKINFLDSGYQPTDVEGVMDAYDLLEENYPELLNYQRGSLEYLSAAKSLVQETAQGIEDESASMGVVSDLAAKIAQYSQQASNTKMFEGASDDHYLGALQYLEGGLQESGGTGDLLKVWQNLLSELDQQGLLSGMIQEFGDFTTIVGDGTISVEELIAKLYELHEAAKSMDLAEAAEKLRESRDANIASTNDYQQQVSELMASFESGGVSAAMETYNGFLDSIQSGIQERFPNLVLALLDANQAAKTFADGTEDMADAEANAQKTSESLRRELNNITKNNATKYFSNTAKAIEGLNKGTTKVSDAYAAFNKESETAIKAQAEFKQATANMSKGTENASKDVQNLAKFLGDLDPEWIINNLDQVGPMLSAALAEGEEAFNRLNEAAFINITGTSSADFSAITNGLIAVRADAEATIAALQATGQWELVEEELPAEMPVFDVVGGRTTQVGTLTATGKQTFLKMKSGNPFSSKGGGGGSSSSSKSSGGGGGGGGGNQNKGPSEVEIMLDRMAQIQSLQDHTRSLYSAQASYYQQTGELQGVIKYYEKEIGAIKEQNTTLEANVAELETWIEKKRAEVNSLDKSSEEYTTAADELKKLQDRHQEYTLSLINNRTEVDKLTKAIKEQKDAIREMEIDLRNTILQAIEDREELQERMLQGTIEVENTILDLIQKRYEKERDLILKNTQDRIDALEREKSLLEEQLQLRREQAEEEEKAAQLAELEAKYSRIAADPTRRKEMLSIEKQINELRDEIAWDTAEKEVKAQQDAIDEQIDSLDEYMAYVEDYYEDLFEHPKKLIEEMKTIIIGTDEEIIEWLKKNSEDYADHTEATQTDMVNGWHSMLDDMRGAITTYWEEVESIIAMGDEAIIEFLKNNSADYRAAGKLQAEAYVDEWQKKLDDLRLAYRQVTADIESYNYEVIEKGNAESKNNGGGNPGGTEKTNAAGAIAGAIAAVVKPSTTITAKNNFSDAVGVKAFNTLMKYDSGGVADYTGLAWIDGKPGRPERILSPYQTDLFEDLVQSLDYMSRVSVPAMPYMDGDIMDRENSVSVGDIIVNVEKMDDDADYEEMAEKVFDQIMNRLNRGSVVGGIRLTR